jgi:hypothetical protein
MNIIQLLRQKNPQALAQAVQILASSASPYAIELLREIAQRSKDTRLQDSCKKAALQIRREIAANFQAKGKRKTVTALETHAEILVSLAYYSLDDLQAKNAQRAVARAYCFDKDVFKRDSLYQDIAEKVFHTEHYNLESRIADFLWQDVKHHRTLKSNYPFYMYFIDVPIVIICGLILLGVSNLANLRSFIRLGTGSGAELDPTVLMIIAVAILFTLGGRIAYIIFEQWAKKKQFGWEKEAEQLAIAHLEGEIQKIVAVPR